MAKSRAQQAAIAISMKKAGKSPKNKMLKGGRSPYMERMRKYQPGGMRMYGDPKLGDQTVSNIIYQESEVGKQQALEEEMKQAQADNTAMEEANAALQRNYAMGNRIEATGQSALQAGKKGLLKLASDPLKGQTPNWSAAMIPNAAGETASLASGTVAGAATDAATELATDAATDVASKGAGKLATFASKYVNPQHAKAVNPYAIAGQIAGAGISYLSDDDDATTLNFGEGAGGVISGAASGASLGSLLGPVGTVVGGTIGGLYGLGKGLYQRNKARNTIGAAEDEKTAELNRIGARMRREGVRSREYSGYDFGRTLAKHGGVRLPGGTMNPIPGSDAVEFKGKSHKQGGILLDEQTEVEGGETMDKVTMKNEGPSDYFFSKYLKLGGKSYAQRHKDILKKGGSQQDIDALAKSQEIAAGRNPGIIEMMQRGGIRKYQNAGQRENLSIPSTEFYGDETGEYGGIPGYQPKVMVNNMMMYGDPNDPEFNSLIQSKDFGENWMNNADPEILKAAGIDSFEDMSDSSKVRRYQQEWNKRNKDNRVLVDGKFGEQTVRTAVGDGIVRIPSKPLDPKDIPTPEPSLNLVPNFIEPTSQKGSNKKGDKALTEFPYGALAAGFGQLIPPIVTFATKENPITMGPIGRIGKPVLDRVDYNDQLMANAAGSRAITKAIDTQGMGPASIISKMAAYGRKQEGDMKIAGAEARANTQIDVTEKQMGQRADMFNVQNAMRADMYNTGILEQARKDQLDRRFAAVDAFADRTAGLYGDYLSYKGQERLAQAVGDQGIYEADLLIRNAMNTKNPATGKNYTRAEAKALFS